MFLAQFWLYCCHTPKPTSVSTLFVCCLDISIAAVQSCLLFLLFPPSTKYFIFIPVMK